MNPIIFNNAKYTVVEVTDSAEKHFSSDSETFYRYIVQYLNGENWDAIGIGIDGHDEYITASATSIIKPIYAQSDYRETYFKTFPEHEKIVFFHGVSIHKKQYEAALHKMLLQINQTRA